MSDTKVVMGNDSSFPRLPKGENKMLAPKASMQENPRISQFPDGQVSETAHLAKLYQNPKGMTGNKRTIDDNIANPQSTETECGMQAGINNHTTGHLGTHKI